MLADVGHVMNQLQVMALFISLFLLTGVATGVLTSVVIYNSDTVYLLPHKLIQKHENGTNL